jgi:hypothetical protein
MLSIYQEARMDVSRTPDFVLKAWKSADIVDSGHIRALRIPPDPEASSTKVLRLLYANNGKYLLTLSSNAILKLWKWGSSEKNPRGRVRCMGELNYFYFDIVVLFSYFLKAVITFC